MRLCAQCGYITDSPQGLCSYHVRDYGVPSIPGDNWGAGNRIMCDFVHRGIVLTTTPSTARRDHDDSGGEVQAEPSGRLTTSARRWLFANTALLANTGLQPGEHA